MLMLVLVSVFVSFWVSDLGDGGREGEGSGGGGSRRGIKG